MSSKGLEFVDVVLHLLDLFGYLKRRIDPKGTGGARDQQQ